MSEKFRLDRKIGFQNTFYTKSINVIIDSIGPSIILRSILFYSSVILSFSFYNTDFAQTWAFHQGVRIFQLYRDGSFWVEPVLILLGL